MAIVIRAHFDGKTIVPDEPVDLPVGKPLRGEFTLVEADAAREAAWQRLKTRKVRGSSIPLEALRRENMYEDRV